jgi:hypothetical protein
VEGSSVAVGQYAEAGPIISRTWRRAVRGVEAATETTPGQARS